MQRSAVVCTEEGKGEEHAYTDHFERMQKMEEERGPESKFSEDLPPLVFG